MLKTADKNINVYSFLVRDTEIQNLDEILNNITEFDKRFAGYTEKDKLKEYLQGYTGTENIENLQISQSKEKEIVDKTIETINKCNSTLPFSGQFQIFFLPTKSEFVKEKMAGVSGFTSYKNTLIIFIHKDSDLSLLVDTIAHEYNHAIILGKIKWLTIGEGVVAEGLAENFREYVVGGKLTPWAESLDEADSKKYFKEIEQYLNIEDGNKYQEIFTSSKGAYPLWSGYAIGYWLIKNYLNALPSLKWEEIMNEPVEEIVKKSNFGQN